MTVMYTPSTIHIISIIIIIASRQNIAHLVVLLYARRHHLTARLLRQHFPRAVRLDQDLAGPLVTNPNSISTRQDP